MSPGAKNQAASAADASGQSENHSMRRGFDTWQEAAIHSGVVPETIRDARSKPYTNESIYTLYGQAWERK